MMNRSKYIKAIILIALFASLTAVGAFIKIPLPGVPVTLQTFFVYLSANVLGAYYGMLSQIIYLTLGLIGIPLFAYGGGPSYFVYPTFGFLLAYPICALIAGKILKLLLRKKGAPAQKSFLFAKVFLADIIGLVVIFFIGMSYLYLNLKWGLYLKVVGSDGGSSVLNWSSFTKMTALVLIPVDLIKIALASFITIKLIEKAPEVIVGSMGRNQSNLVASK